MNLLRSLFLLIAIFSMAQTPIPACSLCGGLASQQRTLRQDWEQARVVLYGTLANPRFTAGAAGAGQTDFHIEKRLKGDAPPDLRTLILGRYIPVLDPKNPPRFVVFCDVIQGKLEPSGGRAVRSPALLDYLKGMESLRGLNRPQVLQYFFRFLDHEDDALAEDAFLEFVHSNDLDIGQAARLLRPDKVRQLVQKPEVSPERLSLFAFLLGACGQDKDGALLRSLVDRPNERTLKALDGILGGYINLRPREGWELALKILADRRRPFPQRYAVVRTMRFYQGWKPAESRQPILRGLDVLIEDGEMADLAVEDLRRWKIWDLTAKVLAQYGKTSHSSPIVRRTIVRYALCCPQPEARTFIDRVRRQDAELVGDVEESLAFEQQPKTDKK